MPPEFYSVFYVRCLHYFFDMLHYIEAIISDAVAQSSECPQLHCTPSAHSSNLPPLTKKK